jgi:hypothetical protein
MNDRKPLLFGGALVILLVAFTGVLWVRSQEAPASPPTTLFAVQDGSVFGLTDPVDPTRDPIPLEHADPIPMEVYLTPTCGCCSLWVDHMAENGFEPELRYVTDQELNQVKQRLDVRPELSSCHTAIVNGYVVEGHVPADVVRDFLAEAPPMRGIAAPGMPVGSPGMEVGGIVEPYDVVAFTSDGRAVVYSRQGRTP